MKSNIRYIFLFIALLAVVSCKKDNPTPAASTDYTSQFETQSDDVNRFNQETDAIDADVDAALQTTPAMNGQRVESIICDATITYTDTLSVDTRTLTINYTGVSCDGLRRRTGNVVVSIPAGQKWKDKGASVTIIANVIIVRMADNKSITISGTRTNTNVSGGLVKDIATLDTVTHAIATASEGIAVTFDDGSARTWYLAKQRRFTYNNGEIITLTGTHSDGTVNDIAVWGTNRLGNSFSTEYTAPVKIEESCDFRIVSGEITHEGLAYAVTVTYGLDSTGSTVTTCPSGPFYYEIAWTIGTNTTTKVLPY